MLHKIKIFFLIGGILMIAPVFFVANTNINLNELVSNLDLMQNDDNSVVTEDQIVTTQTLPRSKPTQIEVRALYLTAHTAADTKRLDNIIEILNNTELNSLVIDIKDYTGHVYYDSQIPIIKENKLSRNVLSDLQALIDKLHQNNIYVIARQTVFQDPALAESMPEWAVKSTRGGLWKDWKGLTWVDTSKEEVWDYNIELAKEVATLGFDEINFDYIRFPSDGPLSQMKFERYDGTVGKEDIVAGFFEKLYEALKDEPVWLSADLFGLTTVRTDDMNIGQLLEKTGPYFDYIMPMMYPSHYPTGFMKFNNPANHPYEIYYDGVLKAIDRLSKVPNNRAKIRPWIQDFDIGAVYGYEKVQAQIKAIVDAGGDGYASWNARNVYNINDYEINGYGIVKE